jgi:hypothetical protein
MAARRIQFARLHVRIGGQPFEIVNQTAPVFHKGRYKVGQDGSSGSRSIWAAFSRSPASCFSASSLRKRSARLSFTPATMHPGRFAARSRDFESRNSYAITLGYGWLRQFYWPAC